MTRYALPDVTGIAQPQAIPTIADVEADLIDLARQGLVEIRLGPDGRAHYFPTPLGLKAFWDADDDPEVDGEPPSRIES
ncbi:hypothetical protein [Nonomuraea typhae]|uniref:hypothetical protein n=1 Tax=Nonomuraea typhae TaxID=2603600 RepID=UPI0012FA3717|nr:hypothetical protein [Nonomuraea typhae]